MPRTADDQRGKAAVRMVSPASVADEPEAVAAVALTPMPAEAGAPPESGIGERLRYARSQLALSTEGLARLTRSYDRPEAKGISGTSIARYESGASQPAARELRLLCEALEVPVGWLLLGAVPNGGRTPAEQNLLAALAGYVREVARDVNIGGEPVSQLIERGNREMRAKWLAQARKPESSAAPEST